MNPKIQPTSPLDLAGVAVATPAAGLVKMKVFLRDKTIPKTALRVSSNWRHKAAIRRMRPGNGEEPPLPTTQTSLLLRGVTHISALP